MIALLTGQLLSKTPISVVIENHGIAYELSIPLSTFFHLPEPPAQVTLNTYLTLKNDTVQFYGFLTTAEKNTFLVLINISGIGPKSALAVLSTLSIPDLVTAVHDNNTAAISAVPGIGKKSAQRLALELKDKMEGLISKDTDTLIHFSIDSDHMLLDAQSALVNLGYKPLEAKKNLKDLRDQHDNLQDLINAVLKKLAK